MERRRFEVINKSRARFECNVLKFFGFVFMVKMIMIDSSIYTYNRNGWETNWRKKGVGNYYSDFSFLVLTIKSSQLLFRYISTITNVSYQYIHTCTIFTHVYFIITFIKPIIILLKKIPSYSYLWFKSW